MLNALSLTLIEHWPGGIFCYLGFSSLFVKLAPKIPWFFLVRQLLHEEKHGKESLGCSPTDAGFDGQGPCGLDQREGLRRSGERPLWMDGPGFTGLPL